MITACLAITATTAAQSDCPPNFAGQSACGVGNSAIAMAQGDFNRDGTPDLVVASYSDNNVSILLGDGGGGFIAASPATVGAGTHPVAVAVGDWDRDGDPDLAVANTGNRPSFPESSVTIHLGNGAGGFQLVSLVIVGLQPAAIVTDDFNRDGSPDLAVANLQSDTVSILLGAGNGLFNTASHYAAGDGPSSMVVGDFNRDGKADLAAAGGDAGTIYVLLGNGNGSFQAPVPYGSAPYDGLFSIGLGDFNGDGKLDLAGAFFNAEYVSVYRGNGNGTFQTAVSYGTDLGPRGVDVGDFNGDGTLDLAVGIAHPRHVSIFPGIGDGTFDTAFSFGSGNNAQPDDVIVGDFNGDGKPDVATATFVYNNQPARVDVFLQNAGAAAPTITTQPAPQTVVFGDSASFTVGANAHGSAPTYQWRRNGVNLANNETISGATTATLTINAVFLNDDGAGFDCVVTNGCDSTFSDTAGLSVSPVSCAASFATGGTYSAGGCSLFTAIGDLNGDGRPDQVVTNACSRDISVLLGTGGGAFAAAVNHPLTGQPQGAAIGDLNGDDRLDVVVANANIVSALLGNGDGTFATAVNNSAGTGPRGVAIADMNGDGLPDMAVANYTSGDVSVLLGNGDGTFADAVDYATGATAVSVAIGDLNGNGLPDLAVANIAAGTVSVLLGIGDGTFAASVNYAAGRVARSVAIRDLNGDGLPDLAVANDGVSVLLGIGDGTFAAAVDYAAGAAPVTVAIGDLNGDGRPDLAVANDGGGATHASVLLGNGNGMFQDAIGFGANSRATSVAIGDLNGDGRLDLAAAHFGPGNASVLLNDGPGVSFSLQPINQTVAAGETAVLETTANGDGPLLYQWRRDGVPLIEGGPFTGVTTDTLTIADAIIEDFGVYDVRVRGGCNLGTSVLSQPAVLTIAGADLNFDGVVDLFDYLLFQQSFTGSP